MARNEPKARRRRLVSALRDPSAQKSPGGSERRDTGFQRRIAQRIDRERLFQAADAIAEIFAAVHREQARRIVDPRSGPGGRYELPTRLAEAERDLYAPWRRTLDYESWSALMAWLVDGREIAPGRIESCLTALADFARRQKETPPRRG